MNKYKVVIIHPGFTKPLDTFYVAGTCRADAYRDALDTWSDDPRFTNVFQEKINLVEV